jgi:hypothetical protein
MKLWRVRRNMYRGARLVQAVSKGPTSRSGSSAVGSGGWWDACCEKCERAAGKGAARAIAQKSFTEFYRNLIDPAQCRTYTARLRGRV